MLMTVFGASGATGRHVVEQALERGDSVEAVVRDPASLPLRHERLRVVEADVLGAAPLSIAGEVVVSCIGPRSRKAGPVASRGTSNILAAMDRGGQKRIVVISAAPLGEPDGTLQRLLYGVLLRAFREVYDDLRLMESELRSSPSDWTVLRPPRLTNGPRTQRYRTAIDRGAGNIVSRADLASEMLRVLDDPATVRHTVGIGLARAGSPSR